MRGLREEGNGQEGGDEEAGQEGLLNQTAAALPLGAAAFVSTGGSNLQSDNGKHLFLE